MAGLREALDSAYDELDGGVPAEQPAAEIEQDPTPEPAEAAPVEDAPAPERNRDEGGRFTKKPTAEAKPAGTPPAPVGAKVGGAVAPPPAAPPPSSAKAPQSWKPLLREKWTALPPEVQQEVLRREREVAVALQQAAEKGKSGEPWNEAVRPYEAQIRAAGMEPAKYVGNLLQTAHALSYGSEQQKATTLAEVIMSFGVSPQALDQALVARMQGRQMPQQQAQAPQFADPRVDKLLQALEAQKTQREQSVASEADSRIDSFASSHDFYDDVADTMQSILLTWEKQGRHEVSEADLERAYNLACSMDEGIAQILDQRKAAEAARTRAAATGRARAAASSIRNQPTAAPAAQPTGRRAVLEAAFDDIDSR